MMKVIMILVHDLWNELLPDKFKNESDKHTSIDWKLNTKRIAVNCDSDEWTEKSVAQL